MPQYTQPHALLVGGLQAMEKLFPGFSAELVAAGGVSVDWLRDINSVSLATHAGPAMAAWHPPPAHVHLQSGLLCIWDAVSCKTISAVPVGKAQLAAPLAGAGG